MSRYRKIDPRLWKDEKLISLNQTEKLITLYCLTAQSNRIGLFNFSPAQASEDLGLSPQTFAKGFDKVCKNLFWGYDKRYRVLYIPTWWKYNCPENPNVLKSCLTDTHELPETSLLSAFYDNIKYLPETFHETFRKGYVKPSPNQEQEQEQEQEQDKEGPAPGAVKKILFGTFVKLTQPEYDRLRDEWGEKKLQSAISQLDYSINKGAKYADHNLTLRNWENRGYFKDRGKSDTPGPPSEPAKPRYVENKDGTWTKIMPDGSESIVDKPPKQTEANDVQKFIKTLAGG